MRVVSIVGARPQYIKVAPLHAALSASRIDHQVINTGQHYDYEMAGVFFKELKLPRPRYNLEVGSATPGEMVARILDRCARKLRLLAPDTVVVYGDTNSTLGGALAAAQLNIPVAHVEAGLRCFDLTVPEELNRVITDRISQVRFCPTPQSVKNLKEEGITHRVFLTGDVLYDVLKKTLPNRADRLSILHHHSLSDHQFLLLTIHRSDTVDNRGKLAQLVAMLSTIDERICFPIHPRTKKRLHQYDLWRKLTSNSRLMIIDPLGYRETLALIVHCRIALTDSGGIQREAFYLRVPTVLLRDVTEWVEINQSGGSQIAGLDERKLKRALTSRNYDFGNRAICRTGASQRIATKLIKLL